MAKHGHDERQIRFDRMWTDHHRHVLAYCLRRADRSVADDVCAEVFVVAWRRLDDVPEPPRTLPYLYGVAGHVLSNQRRSSRRRVRLDERLRVVQPTLPGVAELSDDDRVVAAAVRGLKRVDREVVMLHAWEDLPHDDIAEIMGMSRAAVDQRLHRAYRLLERQLAKRLDRPRPRVSPAAGEGAA
jgi:RNA polymerase sigma-70 factor (ECF subfamily)